MAKILIEGIIGLDTTVEGVRQSLSDANGKDVVAEIASPGGLISEGLLIYNELKNYEGNVDTHLMGSVASMATYIAMIGNHRTAENNAVFMIHNGSGLAIGDYRVMLKYGAHLDSLTNIIAKEMALKSETDLAKIRTAMDETTVYYGDEIKDAGFVHEMIGDAEPEDRAEAVAMAELMIEECQAKINTPESVKKDMNALATMLAERPAAKKPAKSKKQEDVIMTLAEMKEKHPELYAQLFEQGVAKGVIDGVTQERDRVKGLTEMRASFPKPHSQKVIDTAISEGHDTATLSVNLMAADQAQAELEKAKGDDAIPPGGGDADVPEMKDGIMTHPDHLDATAKEISEMAGVL